MNEITQNHELMSEIWSDIKNGGVPLFICLLFIILWNSKVYFKTIMDWLVGNIVSSHKQKEYTKDEVLKHPIFRNLDFWLNTGIDSITFRTLAIPSISLMHHDEDKNYSEAKEEIARELLKIKFQCIKDIFEDFIKEFDFEKIEKSLLKKYIENSIDKCRIKQQKKYVESTIPSLFISKYLALEKVSDDVISYSITMFFESNLNVSNCSLVYLTLNVLDNYLTTIFNNVAVSIQSINGDLNGCEYKGKIIGRKPVEVIQPPHPTYPLIVKDILLNILTEFKASRVSVIRYFKDNTGNYLHSCVYEACDKGITPELRNVQKEPNIVDGDIYSILKDGTVVSADISKFSNYLSEKLSKKGVNGIVSSPIFENDKLIGALVLDYVSIDTYEKVNQDLDDKKLLEHSKNISQYIIYPKDYKF